MRQKLENARFHYVVQRGGISMLYVMVRRNYVIYNTQFIARVNLANYVVIEELYFLYT